MKRLKAALLACFCLTLALCASFPTATANSAEPPGLTVLVMSPPDDLKLSLRFADGTVTGAVPLQREQKAWEAYYRFFYHTVRQTGNPSFDGTVLVVQTSGTSFDCPLPSESFGTYNNLVTLDLARQSVTAGQPAAREALLVALRVCLTLLIEGVIFFAFGYRKRKSWLVFLLVNLITQGGLNLLLRGPSLGSYWFFGYLFLEAIIFIAEMASYSLLLTERKRSRAALCALASNTASLLLGGVLLSYLPV